jgi:hypothetical protein
MRRDRADAADLVRSDRDAEACAADQDRAVGITDRDLLGRVRRDPRVVGVPVRIDADVVDGFDEGVGEQISLDAFLVVVARVVRADNQSKCHISHSPSGCREPCVR